MSILSKSSGLQLEQTNKKMSSSFDHLFLTYYKPLVAYAYKLTLDRQSAEDIVQDIFMSVWVRKEDIDFIDIQAYLYKAAYRKAIDTISAKKNRQEIAGPDIIESYLARQDPGPDPFHDLAIKEVIQEINLFIESLPPQNKRVFTLSRESRLSNKEIAELLQISEKAIEKHITKALFGLKAHLQKQGLFLISLFLGSS